MDLFHLLEIQNPNLILKVRDKSQLNREKEKEKKRKKKLRGVQETMKLFENNGKPHKKTFFSLP